MNKWKSLLFGPSHNTQLQRETAGSNLIRIFITITDWTSFIAVSLLEVTAEIFMDSGRWCF